MICKQIRMCAMHIALAHRERERASEMNTIKTIVMNREIFVALRSIWRAIRQMPCTQNNTTHRAAQHGMAHHSQTRISRVNLIRLWRWTRRNTDSTTHTHTHTCAIKNNQVHCVQYTHTHTLYWHRRYKVKVTWTQHGTHVQTS